jgi:hypothetical protein
MSKADLSKKLTFLVLETQNYEKSIEALAYASTIAFSICAFLLGGSALAILIWLVSQNPPTLYGLLFTDFFSLISPNKFMNVLNQLSSYNIIILIIVACFVSTLVLAVKAVMIRTNAAIEFYGPIRTTESTFYKTSIKRGSLLTVWLDQLTSGVILTWAVSGIATVTNINMVVTIVVLHIAAILFYWISDEVLYWERKFKQIFIVTGKSKRSLTTPSEVISKEFDRYPTVYPLLMSLLCHTAAMITLIIYLSYSAHANQNEMRSYRIAVVPVYLISYIAIALIQTTKYGITETFINSYYEILMYMQEQKELAADNLQIISRNFKLKMAYETFCADVILNLILWLVLIVFLWISWTGFIGLI